MSRARCDTVPHVAVADGGHRDHGPPEGAGDGLEEGLLVPGLEEIHEAREEDHAWNTQKERPERAVSWRPFGRCGSGAAR